MVAYSFQRQFAERILDGTKGGTIRAARKRQPYYGTPGAHRPAGHARPGEELQLYTGIRTKQCQLIARRQCVAVEPIILNFAAAMITFYCRGARFDQPKDLHAFARFDGFSTWRELVSFWHQQHGCGQGFFVGWHIRWLPLPNDLVTNF